MTTDPILQAAQLFIGWGYGQPPRVPRAAKGLPDGLVVEQGDERIVDCSTMTTAILAYAYPDACWSDDTYQRLQTWAELKDPWAAVYGVEIAGAGAPSPLQAGHWHLAQGWRSLEPDAWDGHAMLLYSPDGVHVAVLESRPRVGPSWRLPSGSERLTREGLERDPPAVLTYEQLQAAYPAGVRLAVLARPVEHRDSSSPAGAAAPSSLAPGRRVRPGGPGRAELEDLVDDAVEQVSDGLADGRLSSHEARALLVDVVAGVVDAAIPTGPLDPVDDAVWSAVVGAVAGAVERIGRAVARRDPLRIRQRADRAELRGNTKRAQRRRNRADRIERRR